MSFIGEKMLKRLRKDDVLTSLKKDLEKSLEQLEQLRENLNHGQQIARTGSWTYDIKKGEIFRTEELYNIYECTPQEMDNKLESFYSHVHPDDIEEVMKADQGALEGNEYDIEYRVVTTDGKEKYVHGRTKVLFDEENNPTKLIGIVQDITERRLIENNLRVLGENLIQAQRVAGVGSWKYDVLKDEFYGSDEMFHIYGIAPQDFKNGFSNVIKLAHPEDQIKLIDAMKKILSGQLCEVEYRIPQLDGTDKFVIGKGKPIFDDEGQVVGILGTLQDITENKVLE